MPPSKVPDPRFVAIFESEFDYVWRSLRRLGVESRHLDDRTHDVFVEVYRRFDRYDPERPIKPWLFAFAFRIASSHRNASQQRRELLDEPDVEHAAPGPNPEDELARKQTRALVLRALEKVELSRRAVLILYEIDGCTMHEIAQSLEIPIHTAYSRLRVARTELTDALRRLDVRREQA